MYSHEIYCLDIYFLKIFSLGYAPLIPRHTLRSKRENLILDPGSKWPYLGILQVIFVHVSSRWSSLCPFSNCCTNVWRILALGYTSMIPFWKSIGGNFCHFKFCNNWSSLPNIGNICARIIHWIFNVLIMTEFCKRHGHFIFAGLSKIYEWT